MRWPFTRPRPPATPPKQYMVLCRCENCGEEETAGPMPIGAIRFAGRLHFCDDGWTGLMTLVGHREAVASDLEATVTIPC